MKLVLVEWIDSHSGRGWLDRERIENACQPLYCRSVGWVVKENAEVISIVSSISSEKINGDMIQGCGDIVIPKKAIKKMTILK